MIYDYLLKKRSLKVMEKFQIVPGSVTSRYLEGSQPEAKRPRVSQSRVTLSPLHQKLMVHFENACEGLNNPQEEITKILQIRDQVLKRPGDATFLQPSATLPRMVIVTKGSFQVVQKSVGSGTFSTAYFTVEIPFSGADPINRVVKSSRHSYRPEITLLDKLSPASKLSRTIDHFIASFFDKGKKLHFAVFEPSDCDFTKVDYTIHSAPVFFMCRQLLDVAKGIASFHRRDIILRDLKGQNLLINHEGPGKVTDFGFLRKLQPEGTKHEATGTGKYLAPFIYDSILGQKYYWITSGAPYEGGYQGKASDIFSLGRVIHFDVICRLLRHFGKVYHFEAETVPFLEVHGEPRIIEGNFSNEVLLGYEQKFPGRVIRNPCSRQKDSLYLFEDHEVLLKETVKLIEKFRPMIHDEECEKLIALAHLARDLQNPCKEEILRVLGSETENDSDCLIQAVADRLNDIITHPTARALNFEQEDFGNIPGPFEALTGLGSIDPEIYAALTSGPGIGLLSPGPSSGHLYFSPAGIQK